MSVNIFNLILDEKLEKFINNFLNHSRGFFLNEESGKLIHSGEFGMFREEICREFLRLITVGYLDIGTGFVISSGEKVSHQCDIIIYDKDNTPLIESKEKQRFFPVETIAAIGEVKSILNKTEFKNALLKLSKVKSFREDMKESHLREGIRGKGKGKKFNPQNDPRDQIFSFLICEKLNFNLEEIHSILNEIYESIPHRFKHNLILSVSDGKLCYTGDKINDFIYPGAKIPALNRLIKPKDDSFPHVKSFANDYFLGVRCATIYPIEIADYISLTRYKLEVIDE